jgi:hypothetical protein
MLTSVSRNTKQTVRCYQYYDKNSKATSGLTTKQYLKTVIKINNVNLNPDYIFNLTSILSF